MHVLTEPEIARLLAAYWELADTADEAERDWWLLSGRLVRVALGTALRRGELLALRWRDIALLDARLTVRESFVRGEFTTPKSRTSRRTIELGSRTLEVLQEQWLASSYRGDEQLVFGHPALGTPLDPSKLSRKLHAAGAQAGEDREAVSPLARPSAHRADARGRGREPAGIRAAEGRSLAGLDHRALHPCRAGALPRRRRERRGSNVRGGTKSGTKLTAWSQP